MEQRVRNIPATEQRLSEDRPKFRFMDLEIWRDAVDIGCALFDVADKLEARKLYRFAEQLRGAGLSMSNNIAEGSGSSSKRDFSSFLNMARRSTFENANVLLVLEKRGLIAETETTELLRRLDRLCRKITNFQKSLRD
jgi:four helix bundle protein